MIIINVETKFKSKFLISKLEYSLVIFYLMLHDSKILKLNVFI